MTICQNFSSAATHSYQIGVPPPYKILKKDPAGRNFPNCALVLCCSSAIKYLLCLQQRRQRSFWTLLILIHIRGERKDTKVPLSATITQYTAQHREAARYESGFNRLFLAAMRLKSLALKVPAHFFWTCRAVSIAISLFTPGESWWFHFVTPPRLPQKIKCLSTYSLTQSKAPPNFLHGAPAGWRSCWWNQPPQHNCIKRRKKPVMLALICFTAFRLTYFLSPISISFLLLWSLMQVN